MDNKWIRDEYYVSTDKNLIDCEVVYEFLTQKSHWAKNRTREIVQRSIENSLCFGVYHNKKQIGFARVMTDYAVTYYLGDVFIIEEYRGKGLGKWLMECVVDTKEIKDLWGILATSDAHGLYEKYGFRVPQDTQIFMTR